MTQNLYSHLAEFIVNWTLTTKTIYLQSKVI